MSATVAPIDTVIAKLGALGCEPQDAGPGQWRSRCPVHEGRSRNLSIKCNSDGSVLLHCHHVDAGGARCSAAQIAQRLGLSMRDLFPSSRREENPKKARTWRTPEDAIAVIARRLGPPAAYWSYAVEEDGVATERMRVYRFNGDDGRKQFRPIHKNAQGWAFGDPPGMLPLYAQPEVLKAERVLVVEGEKCADLVRQLGLPCTTSAHGSQSPHRTDWRLLAGKEVAIVPDNDDAGVAYANAVASALHQLEPRPEVRIIRLELPGKGDDVADWVRDIVPDHWDFTDCRIELERLWARAQLWEPPREEETASNEPPNLTEVGNARRLIRDHGKHLRYVYPRSAWMIWNKQRWEVDSSGAIWRIAKQLPRKIAAEAHECRDNDRHEAILRWSIQTERKKILQASLDLAWSEPGIGVMPDDFDRNPMLLNTPSGVVDLATGELRSARPEDMMSKMTAVPVDLKRDCKRWRGVLADVFEGDEDLIAYMQRALGYCLTGETGEHAMWLCYGSGRNGKNTVLDTVRALMGDYSTVADPRVFLSAGQGDHPAGLADLVGERLVITSEIDEGQRLAESLVKRVTGDKTIKARFMHQNPFEFVIQFKLWFLCNHLPEVAKQDEGIWSRIRIVPFNKFIPPDRCIKGLSEILIAEEGPAILGWLVEGAKEWAREGGLNEPSSVSRATQGYRDEQDVVGDFLRESTDCHLDNETLRTQARCKAADLYTDYVAWCARNGVRQPLTSKKFGHDLTRRGYEYRASNGHYYRFGLTLRSDPGMTSAVPRTSDSAF